MAELVKDDEHAEREQERDDLVGDINHAAIEKLWTVSAGSASSSHAIWRASPSASNASGSDPIARAGSRSSVRAQVVAMSGKRACPARKAPTTISFAALSAIGALPPDANAS